MCAVLLAWSAQTAQAKWTIFSSGFWLVLEVNYMVWRFFFQIISGHGYSDDHSIGCFHFDKEIVWFSSCTRSIVNYSAFLIHKVLSFLLVKKMVVHAFVICL